MAIFHFLGVECPVIESNEKFIRIQTPHQYTEAEIKEGVSALGQPNFPIMQFCIEEYTSRGEEYAAVINGYLWMYELPNQ